MGIWGRIVCSFIYMAGFRITWPKLAIVWRALQNLIYIRLPKEKLLERHRRVIFFLLAHKFFLAKQVTVSQLLKCIELNLAVFTFWGGLQFKKFNLSSSILVVYRSFEKVTDGFVVLVCGVVFFLASLRNMLGFLYICLLLGVKKIQIKLNLKHFLM